MQCPVADRARMLVGCRFQRVGCESFRYAADPVSAATGKQSQPTLSGPRDREDVAGEVGSYAITAEGFDGVPERVAVSVGERVELVATL